MPDNFRHAQYDTTGVQIDDPQRIRGLTESQVAATQALVSEAGKQSAAKNADSAAVRAIGFPMNDGQGATLNALDGKGPAILVSGTTTGAWANPGWFTHDAAGNTLKLANSPYVDGLLDMTTECSIIVGYDLWLDAWPSATETMWGLHRPDLSAGGVRLPMLSASAGRFGVYYRSSAVAEAEVVGFTMGAGTYLGRRLSILTELRVLPGKGELHVFLYINGRMERGNVWPLGTPPATDSAGGLNFSGYGSASLQKLGSSGASGARSGLCFAIRHSGADRTIAERLAAHVWANAALPSWLNRV